MNQLTFAWLLHFTRASLGFMDKNFQKGEEK